MLSKIMRQESLPRQDAMSAKNLLLAFQWIAVAPQKAHPYNMYSSSPPHMSRHFLFSNAKI